MSAIRQTAAQLARRARTARPAAVRSTRSYASGHGHEAPHAVEESLGTGFYVVVGTVAASIFVYSISRPGKDGEQSALHKWGEKLTNYGTEWEKKNHLMTAALQQAAHDKHLLYTAERNKHYELAYPEVLTHGSPFNVPAGHYANIDKVVAHYKKQYHEEEARKAKKLAAASQ